VGRADRKLPAAHANRRRTDGNLIVMLILMATSLTGILASYSSNKRFSALGAIGARAVASVAEWAIMFSKAKRSRLWPGNLSRGHRGNKRRAQARQTWKYLDPWELMAAAQQFRESIIRRGPDHGLNTLGNPGNVGFSRCVRAATRLKCVARSQTGNVFPSRWSSHRYRLLGEK
jgi:hypothetical protein